jgi:hypothetical protein
VEKIAYEYWRLGVIAWRESFLSYRECTIDASDFDLRYETTINRQFYQAINQQERVQRLRAGEPVPAPVNVQVSHDVPGLAKEENPGP